MIELPDDSITYSVWQFLEVAPFVGWPGAILGAPIGAVIVRRHRAVGGAIFALIGCLAVAYTAVYLNPTE